MMSHSNMRTLKNPVGAIVPSNLKVTSLLQTILDENTAYSTHLPRYHSQTSALWSRLSSFRACIKIQHIDLRLAIKKFMKDKWQHFGTIFSETNCTTESQALENGNQPTERK